MLKKEKDGQNGASEALISVHNMQGTTLDRRYTLLGL